MTFQEIIDKHAFTIHEIGKNKGGVNHGLNLSAFSFDCLKHKISYIEYSHQYYYTCLGDKIMYTTTERNWGWVINGYKIKGLYENDEFTIPKNSR